MESRLDDRARRSTPRELGCRVAPVVDNRTRTNAPQAPERLRLALVATDSEGATARASVGIDPSTVEVAVASRRDRARIVVDGTRARTPYRIDVLRGSSIRLATPRVQRAPGRGKRWKLRWRRWSDGGERKHVVTPLSDARYSVSYALERRRGR